jgi:hypothetical protein
MHLFHYCLRNRKWRSVEPWGSAEPCLRNTGYSYTAHSSDRQRQKDEETDNKTGNVRTRWFKYDRDYLCVNKSQFVPVIFEPPSTTYHGGAFARTIAVMEKQSVLHIYLRVWVHARAGVRERGHVHANRCVYSYLSSMQCICAILWRHLWASGSTLCFDFIW